MVISEIRQKLLSIIIPFCLFLAPFEYLFNISVAGLDIRIFQILILLVSPFILSKKSSFLIFSVLTFILVWGLITAAYITKIQHFDENALSFFLQQEVFVLTFSLFLTLKSDDSLLKRSLSANFLGILLISLFGLLQFSMYNLFGLEINLAQHDLMGDHLKWRVYGFFSEPNMFAIYIAFALPMYYYGIRSSTLMSKVIFLFPVFLALFLSYSRGALIAVFVAIVLWSIHTKKVKFTFFLLFSPVALFLIIKIIAFGTSSESLYRLSTLDVASDPSSSGRLDAFIGVMRYFNDNSIRELLSGIFFGNGQLTFRTLMPVGYVSEKHIAMNIYLDIIFEYGIIILLTLIISLLRGYKKYLKKFGRKSISDGREIIAFVVPLFLIMGLFYPLRSVFAYQLPLMFSIFLIIATPSDDLMKNIK